MNDTGCYVSGLGPLAVATSFKKDNLYSCVVVYSPEISIAYMFQQHRSGYTYTCSFFLLISF